MIELLLSIIAVLLTALLAVVGWFGVTVAEGVRLVAARLTAMERLHLKHHPADFEHLGAD
jgi:hypothetical protein